jgi:T-complex protein 1 subunit delta
MHRPWRSSQRHLQVILSENAGLNTIKVVTELRNMHIQGKKKAGISMKKFGILEDMETEKVI